MSKDYGIHIIIGRNGTGKTFYTHTLRVYDFWRGLLGRFLPKKNTKKRTVYIGNYTSPDFDIIFRSRDDLVKILLKIIASKTNSDNDKISYVIVIDEIHKYFSNRDFKNFPKVVVDFLSEVRKQDVTIYGLSPNLLLIDSYLRRLTYDVRRFKKWLLFRYYEDFELIAEDSSNLDDKSVATYLGITPLAPIWLVLYFVRLSTKYTKRYDTKEIVFTDISIVDNYDPDFIDPLFPDPIYLTNSLQVFEFIKYKINSFLSPQP